MVERMISDRPQRKGHAGKRPFSFQARSKQIHESLGNAIKEVESAEMMPE
jgi:hypothetical protein